MSYQEFFKGKRVTILGLGLLGRGVGDAAFLAESGATVTVTDKKSEGDLSESISALAQYPIIFHLNGHIESDFTNTDMVVKAAGVPLDSPEIAVAKKAGVPVYMSTALFAKFAMEMGATVVGVTGTRGKSTVAHMLFHALDKVGKRARLGGNVRGVSTLKMLPNVKAGDMYVLELDSWQLQGFGDLGISPHVAIVTNFMPDHQNYYPDMATYFADKASIFRHQRAGDTLIVGAEVQEQVKAAQPPVEAVVPPAIPVDWTLKIPGEHNRVNASLAVAALEKLGLSADDVRAGIESFGGVEGRLQFVREMNGVRIYNDNNATTPEATLVALASFPLEKIILIMGGADKGLNMEILVAAAKKCKKVVLLAGTGTERVRTEVGGDVFDALEPAVAAALSDAATGDIVLFSPACASFGMFKNEYDRNDQFLRTIEKL